MYWQVYLHKTVVCAEEMLIKLILRAKYLVAQGQKLPCSKALAEFLYKDQADNLRSDKKLLINYANLDDIDILSAVKSWQYEEDKILAFLARSLQERKLFKIKLQEDSFDSKKIETVKHQIMRRFELNEPDADFLIINKSITTYLYNPKQVEIKILGKNGKLQDFDKASDQWSSLAMQKAVTKHYCCYPKSAS